MASYQFDFGFLSDRGRRGRRRGGFGAYYWDIPINTKKLGYLFSHFSHDVLFSHLLVWVEPMLLAKTIISVGLWSYSYRWACNMWQIIMIMWFHSQTFILMGTFYWSYRNLLHSFQIYGKTEQIYHTISSLFLWIMAKHYGLI